jgi:repressor LexA
MRPLTNKQQAILNFIEEFVATRHYPPTYEEIRVGLGLSTKSLVDYHLTALEEAGYIRRDRLTPRGLRLAKGDSFQVPLVGSIGASLPATFYTDLATEALVLTRDIVPEQDGLFALKVRGTSMIDAMVNDGDIVVMKKQAEAHNGDMVAARLVDRDETTLKYFFRDEPHRVRLQPANPTLRPIFTHPANVEIQGRVVAVIRRVN